MTSYLLLVTSSPYSPQAARALGLAGALRRLDHPVSAFLLQDAVLAGLEPGTLIAPAVAEGVACYALDEDLALRGFTPRKLAPGVEAADYGKLVELMMEQHDRVLGAF